MVDYRKFNIQDELTKINGKDRDCTARLREIENELTDVQFNIKHTAETLSKAHTEYAVAKEKVDHQKVLWIFRAGNLDEFKACQEESEKIRVAKFNLDRYKERATMLTEERKQLRDDRSELASQTGKYYRMMQMIGNHAKTPLITQVPVRLDSKGGSVVLTLKVNVYYRNYDVHSKIDIYFKKRGLWYMDMIDYSKKVSKSRADAIEKLIEEYKVKSSDN